jgi:hypothetical protein
MIERDWSCVGDIWIVGIVIAVRVFVGGVRL